MLDDDGTRGTRGGRDKLRPGADWLVEYPNAAVLCVSCFGAKMSCCLHVGAKASCMSLFGAEVCLLFGAHAPGSSSHVHSVSVRGDRDSLNDSDSGEDAETDTDMVPLYVSCSACVYVWLSCVYVCSPCVYDDMTDAPYKDWFSCVYVCPSCVYVCFPCMYDDMA